jgi:hypothetical protein
MFRLIIALLLFVVPLEAQDYSTTPMQVEKTFHLTVTVSLKPGHESQVFAIQDPELIEWFTNCWNNSFIQKNHAGCGEFINTLMFDPWHRGVQLKDAPGTYVFREMGGFPILTTLIVATNDHCVGAYVIPSNKAHGNLLANMKLTCGSEVVRTPQRDPRCPPRMTTPECQQMAAVSAMIGGKRPDTPLAATESGDDGAHRVPGAGLHVNSRPAGADIFINDAKPSGQTPATLALAPGYYSLVLRYPGYEAYVDHFQVKDNVQTTLDAELKEIPAGHVAWAQVNSTPEGAEIFVDGTPTGQVSPARVQIQAGSHIIALRLNDYEIAKRGVQASGDGTVSVTETLKKK